ncbi:MAG: hypothetical protein QXI39_07685 [Candidatus Bathyarchaeia archaeon]
MTDKGHGGNSIVDRHAEGTSYRGRELWSFHRWSRNPLHRIATAC